MATTVARLQAVLTANTAQFTKSMMGAESRMVKTRKVAGLAGLAIAGGLAYGMEKSVKAAMEAEESQGRLNVAFKNSGLSAKNYTKEIASTLSAGRKLGFTNSQQRTALGTLIVATHNYSKAQRELGIAEDISRFKHVDLASATKMLAMAQTGSQRATKQLGLSVQASTKYADAAKISYQKQMDALDKQYPSLTKLSTAQQEHVKQLKEDIKQQYAGTLASAKFEDKQVTAGKVIDLVSAKLKGQSAEYSHTAAGSMEVFHAQVSNIEGQLGKALIPALTQATQTLSGFATVLGEHPGVVKKVVLALGAFSFALLTLNASMKIVAATQKALMLFSGPWGVALGGLLIAVGLLTYAFGRQQKAAASLKDSYEKVANAARRLKDSEDAAKQAGLDLEQAHLAQKHATDEVYNAQVAYNRAIKESGPHSQAALEALHNLQQAKHDQKQADQDLAVAAKRAKIANDEHSRSLQQVGANIVGVAHQQADAGHSFVSNALTFGRSWHNAKENADDFITSMRNAGKAAQAVNPQIAAAYRAVSDLAKALGRIPSDTTIRFIVQTMMFTPGKSPKGGPFQGGGHARGGRIPGAPRAADSVPAMLSPGEFVVTGGGEKMLESMTFPGVLNWLQGVQPRHFQGGGRVGHVEKLIKAIREYSPPLPTGGGAVSTHGLVPQVLNALGFARDHGWSGSVISGFRTYAEQAALYARYLAGGNIAARPGTSSHEFGQAVDVSQASTFDLLMNRAPRGSQLFNNVPGDFSHFSVSGHRAGGRINRGLFDRGGWLQPGLTLAQNNTGRAERVGGDITIPVSIGGEHVATVVFDMLRRRAKVFEGRNGRTAFG